MPLPQQDGNLSEFPGQITQRMVKLDRQRSRKFRLFKLFLFGLALTFAAAVLLSAYNITQNPEFNWKSLENYLGS